VTHQSGDSSVPSNIRQRRIKKNRRKALSTRLRRRCSGRGQYGTECALGNLKWSDSNKGGCNL